MEKTASGVRMQAVHYLWPDEWELEEISRNGEPALSSDSFCTSNFLASLLLDGIPSKAEFEVRLAHMGLALGGRLPPYSPESEKLMELFEVRQL